MDPLCRNFNRDLDFVAIRGRDRRRSLLSEMISFGAGVNSTAMLILLANEGWRGSVVFSDTGCEWPDTYCFIDYFAAEWMKPRGFDLIVLKGQPWHLKGRDEVKGKSLIEYCEAVNLIPLAGLRWCTTEWKVRPMQRWARRNGKPDQLIGIASDEAQRMKKAHRPLVDRGIDREDCIQIIEAEGLSVPRKSGCYICPFQRPSQWRDLWQNHRHLFDRALALEEASRRRDERTDKHGRAHATIDPSGKLTLRERLTSFENQISMFDDSLMDDLHRYQPCVCGL